MKLSVQFHCGDCESYNQNRPLGYYERDTEFYNLTQAIEHLKEYPDHHVEAFTQQDDLADKVDRIKDDAARDMVKTMFGIK